MTHVSRKKVPVETQKILNDALIHVFSKLSLSETKKILSSLLTKTEQTMLAKRLGIIFLLNDNIEGMKISEVVKTTRQTVTRIGLEILAKEKGSIDFLLTRISTWKRMSILKNFIKDSAIFTVKKILRASVGKS